MYRAATVAVLDAGVEPRRQDRGGPRRRPRPTIEVGTTPAARWCTVDGVDVARAHPRRRGHPRGVAGVRRPRRAPAAGRPAARAGRARPTPSSSRAATSAPSSCPDATLKIYLTAAPEVRAQRRAGQLGRDRPGQDRRAGRRTCAAGTSYDSRRADSPLRPAEDAIVVDSTDLDRAAVVAADPRAGRRRRRRGGAGMTESHRPAAGRRDRRPAQRRQVDPGQPHPGPPRRRRAGHPGRDPRPHLLRGAVERQALHRRRHRRLGPEGHRHGRRRSPGRPSTP